MKEKHLSIRISKDLYNKLIEKALKKGQKEKKIIKVSEIVRQILENHE